MNKRVIVYISICMLFSCKNRSQLETISNFDDLKIEIRQLEDVKLSSGRLFRIEEFPTTLIQTRPIDIWLPEGYSKTKKYAVLYMHDGQMLFDSTTTWNKQEWKVDEWASKLMREGKTCDFIVVAPHNISEVRWNDYFPKKAMDYLSDEDKNEIFANEFNVSRDTTLNADNYLKFLTQELKPFIDSNYSVYSDAGNTLISGSSMGGLISMYAVCEYPDIFGGAACISTHWPGAKPRDDNPIPYAFFKYMRSKVPSGKGHIFYFDYGTETLDQYYPQYAGEVTKIFMEKGYSDKTFRNIKFEGMDHSENSWNQRLDVPFTFLLKK